MDAQAILVVEDDALVRATTVALLETEGYTVLEAASAETGFQILWARPDVGLLLIDIHLPGTQNGMTLAQEAHECRPQLPLLITSGRSAPSPSELPAGARFIQKPYRAKALFEEVSRLLASSPPAQTGGHRDRSAATRDRPDRAPAGA
jgi:DNA-binding NtrC family response regulator